VARALRLDQFSKFDPDRRSIRGGYEGCRWHKSLGKPSENATASEAYTDHTVYARSFQCSLWFRIGLRNRKAGNGPAAPNGSYGSSLC